MHTDLKNYRASGNPWPALIGLAIATAVLTFVGPMDFAYQLELEAENKVIRAELASMRKEPPRMSESAPMRPCARQPAKPEHHAGQADGGKWRVVCRDGYLRVNQEVRK